MTEAVEVALIVSAVPASTSLLSLVISLRHSAKLDHIIVLTNSTLTTAKERIAHLEALLKQRNPS